MLFKPFAAWCLGGKISHAKALRRKDIGFCMPAVMLPAGMGLEDVSEGILLMIFKPLVAWRPGGKKYSAEAKTPTQAGFDNGPAKIFR